MQNDSTITHEILSEIESRIQSSNEQYQDTGSHFFLGEMSALDSLRNFITLISDSQETHGAVSLLDSIDHDERIIDRIIHKLDAIGETMLTVSTLAMEVAHG